MRALHRVTQSPAADVVEGGFEFIHLHTNFMLLRKHSDGVRGVFYSLLSVVRNICGGQLYSWDGKTFFKTNMENAHKLLVCSWHNFDLCKSLLSLVIKIVQQGDGADLFEVIPSTAVDWSTGQQDHSIDMF